METCPICRASLKGATTCRRCRADLQRVQEIERLGQAVVGETMRSLAEGNVGAAEHWLCRAEAVHTTPLVQVLQRLVASRGWSTNAHSETPLPGNHRPS